ncbi:MAG TPA: hypothetical protein VNZ45_10565 [Bacteroidia bacterium]|jgi:hypothetical protein|nr:hypothetical protein [Bacteroidia bacterium]
MGKIFKKIIIFFAWVLIGCAVLSVLALTGYIIYFMFTVISHGHH